MNKKTLNLADEGVETRKNRLIQRRPGGTAGKNSIAYTLPLPTKWLRKMGVTPEEREVVLSFDGTEISVKKAESKMDTAASDEQMDKNFYETEVLPL